MFFFEPGDSYLILKIMGVAAFMIIGTRSLLSLGISLSKALVICAVGVIAAFTTSRVWYIVQHIFGREPYFSDNWATLWDEAGSVLYGWILGGFLALFALCRLMKLNLLKVSDALSVGMLTAQVLNRLGCYAAGCCYGKPLNALWAVYNPAVGQRLHPVQLYEATFDIVLIAVIQMQKKDFDGKKTLIYFTCYSAGRFILEFFRGDNLPVIFGLTVPQLTSLAILLAVFFIWFFQPEPHPLDAQR